MSGKNSDVDRRDRVIEALLTEPNLKAASKTAQVPYTSLRRLLGDPSFQAELGAARTQVLDAALARLRGLAGDAVSVIEQTVSGANVSGLRYRAACWVLDTGVAGLNADLEGRIRKLEARRR